VFIIEDYTCMKEASRWDSSVIIFLFTVQNCGPRKSPECAQWRKLGSFTTIFMPRSLLANRLHDHTIITNVMHWILFIR